ncbi:hypothetical protein [Bradyrhizobium sp. WSM3983]|uniref:hypothetical protein n=1 Tax=Bradyrhizobium sp. WSM3983 TaxID=1038867 RepID=UPI0004898C84|nr:hypothetical protein [Bradyrhizobium sp. WSM3983]
MKTFNSVIRSTSAITALAAGILLVAAQGATAGNHDGNHGFNHFGQGGGSDTRRGMGDPARNAIGAERRGSGQSDRKPMFGLKPDRADKHANKQDREHDKWGRDRERLADGKKMTGPTGKPSDKPVEASSGKPTDSAASKPIASGSANTAAVAPPVNTIHPILSPPAGNVTVSNGVTKYEIPDGAGGVSAYSSAPGKITVTNGKDSVTLNGGSVTVSNALGVGAAQNNVQVGARNGEGKTVVSVAPTPEAPTSRGTVTGFGMPGGPVAKTALKIIDAVPVATFGPPIAAGYGLAKDGVKGAVHGVKESAKVVYDFLTW